MAKGNHSSNWPTAAQPEIQPEKMAKQIQAMETLRQLTPIDYSDPQELGERVRQFFDFCIQNELRPGIELLALSIGVSRMTLWRWEQGGGSRGAIIERAKQLIASLLEQWALTGAVNPTTAIFLQKNHFGYADAYQFEAAQANHLDALPTAQEIRQRLPVLGQTEERDSELSELLNELRE